MRKFSTAFVVASMLVVGCSEPRLDGASEEAMKQSVSRARDSLPESRRKAFDDALATVAMSNIDISKLMAGQKPEDVKRKTLDALSGKTAEEVIALAERTKTELLAKQRAQALQELADLRAKAAKADEAKKQLAAFEVKKSRFRKETDKYSINGKPLIDLTVKNNTGHSISRAYFKGTIASPGRSVPWLVEEFNYKIKGGLENGEEAEWTLEPNQFSEWGKTDHPVDAIFTVEVLRVDGPDEKALFDAKGLDTRERERLKTLEKELGGA